MSAHPGHTSLDCKPLQQLSGAGQGSTQAPGDKPVQPQHRSMAHTTPSIQAAGTRKLRRLAGQTGLAKDSSLSSREAQGSCSSTAERSGQPGPVSGHPALAAASQQVSTSFLGAKQRWLMCLWGSQAPQLYCSSNVPSRAAGSLGVCPTPRGQQGRAKELLVVGCALAR